MRWSILTPDESAYWDGAALTFGPGRAAIRGAASGSRSKTCGATYYKSMFNPARLNPKAMTREMPTRHWATLPEAQLIRPLLLEAPGRVAGMIDDTVRRQLSARLVRARDATARRNCGTRLRQCRGCPLFESGDQVVFGEGPSTATVMLVGEQPGDEEDKQGRPFVGPAGEVFESRAARCGRRAGAGVSHQRRETFLVPPRGQTPDPPEASSQGCARLPAMARSRDRSPSSRM